MAETIKQHYDGYMPLPDGPIAALEFVNTDLTPDDALGPAGHRAVARFRATLRRLLLDEARGVGAADADLDQLGRVLARIGAARRVVPTVRGYGWGWADDPGPLIRHLFPAAWSAAQLLTGDLRHRLKCCSACEALFLDRSRNASRRWCDMGDCGNRAKVRRWRDRHAPDQDR
jgi:predicted RNA-binding Zn ribbon-like protein